MKNVCRAGLASIIALVLFSGCSSPSQDSNPSFRSGEVSTGVFTSTQKPRTN